jgi:heparan-alpha-glucosaminide N-acetyltransferase
MDIKLILTQWLVILAVLLVYLLCIFLIPHSGSCESGYFGPGGKHDYLKHFNCTGGFTGFVDRTILGESHVYQWARIRNVYDALAFDPEGPLGCLISIVHTFIGLQCGMTLISFPTAKERVRRWFCWALVLGIISGILTKFTKSDGWIPINKNLWSLTFVTSTCCLAYLMLIICYILVDVKKIWSGSPFYYPGMNSIILYIGHSVFHHAFPFRMFPQNYRTHFLLTLENLYATGVWIFIAYRLYKAKKFYNL